MEGPYRDLGAGFARLAGAEGLRRTPVPLRSVEDALFELLRNARDAGASNIYVASILKARRYRHLTVLDDGHGIPASHAHLVFEPGVTTRHLSPVPEPPGRTGAPSTAPHGAGLSLHHIRQAAVSAEVLSPSSPTSVRAVFDTRDGLPEKRLQSASKPSRSNVLAVLSRFAQTARNGPRTPPNLFHGSPASILARLIHNRIIQENSSHAVELREKAGSLGLGVSLRTAQRVLSGAIAAAEPLGAVPVGEAGPGVGRGRAGVVALVPEGLYSRSGTRSSRSSPPSSGGSPGRATSTSPGSPPRGGRARS
ncbi:hypothetical protein GBA65_10700 [Rubrobacter marinus]|uniref:Histidine kinase/HSP90-like ATPase domain-containing protein n=1 Tax=Rubrobacter marinus TaxID=2653852 RepID=A0A6G8PXL1_9ACTN|nr:ATP-binding protein [Rubrobacter marinus]QIN78915.1 hypothetical protein GBA65_10700 [Rubrobacter marinus]